MQCCFFFFCTLLISGLFCHTMSFCPIKHPSFQHLFFFVPACVIRQNVLKTPVIVLAPQKRRSDPLWHRRASRVAPRSPRGHHLTQVSMPNPAWCAALKPFCIFLIFVSGLLSRSPPLLAWTAASPTTPPLPAAFRLLTGEVWRPLACRSLSGSPLLAEPGSDLMCSLYWGPYE